MKCHTRIENSPSLQVADILLYVAWVLKDMTLMAFPSPLDELGISLTTHEIQVHSHAVFE